MRPGGPERTTGDTNEQLRRCDADLGCTPAVAEVDGNRDSHRGVARPMVVERTVEGTTRLDREGLTPNGDRVVVRHRQSQVGDRSTVEGNEASLSAARTLVSDHEAAETTRLDELTSQVTRPQSGG